MAGWSWPSDQIQVQVRSGEGDRGRLAVASRPSSSSSLELELEVGRPSSSSSSVGGRRPWPAGRGLQTKFKKPPCSRPRPFRHEDTPLYPSEIRNQIDSTQKSVPKNLGYFGCSAGRGRQRSTHSGDLHTAHRSRRSRIPRPSAHYHNTGWTCARRTHPGIPSTSVYLRSKINGRSSN